MLKIRLNLIQRQRVLAVAQSAGSCHQAAEAFVIPRQHRHGDRFLFNFNQDFQTENRFDLFSLTTLPEFHRAVHHVFVSAGNRLIAGLFRQRD